MKRFRPGLLTAAVLAALVLSACSSTQPPAAPAAAPPAPAAPKAKVTIRLGTWTGGTEAKELQAVIDKINAKSQTFTIVHEPQPDDYYTKMKTVVAGGTAPDLMWLDQENVVPFASRGALLDLTSRLKADKRPAAQTADYYPSILDAASLGGKVYGLPWIAQPVVLYYNKTLFQAAGVATPSDSWGWTDLTDAAMRLTDKAKGQYGFSANGWPPVTMFIWQAGGDLISADGKKSLIGTPEALKGIEYYASLVYNPAFSVPANVIGEQGFGDMFKKGKVAMFMGGAADDLDRVDGLDAGVARVPKGPKDRTTFSWTASTVVSASTKNPNEAYDALVELTEGIQGWKIVSPRKSQATKEHLLQSEPRKAKSADVIISALPDMRAEPPVTKFSDWAGAFWDQVQDPLYNKKGTASDLVQKALPKLDAVLNG